MGRVLTTTPYYSVETRMTPSELFGNLAKIREDNPLVHNIINTVAANFAANALIAIGASPMMASDAEETALVSEKANSLVINVGFVNYDAVQAMNFAVGSIKLKKKRWVLDPVGAGANPIRQKICRDLAALQPSIIRGNGSEILALCPDDIEIASKGVDSSVASSEVLPRAKELARSLKTVIAVTGDIDFVTDGCRIARIANGHPMMAQITASGCALSSILGAFAAVTEDPFEAAVEALSFYAVAGELAAEKAMGGTGSMVQQMLDSLSTMTLEQYSKRARRPLDLSLYLVTDSELKSSLPLTQIVEKAVEGGVSIVQLREKNLDSREFYQRAAQLKQMLSPYNIPLIINDRVDIALAANADGVHIGQTDLPVSIARALLGPNKIIGLSVNSLDEARVARHLDIDYVGVGPVYDTKTKACARAGLGVEHAAELARESRHISVAIGGIKTHNAQLLYAQPEFAGVAVVTAITQAEDPKSAAQALRRLIGCSSVN